MKYELNQELVFQYIKKKRMYILGRCYCSWSHIGPMSNYTHSAFRCTISNVELHSTRYFTAFCTDFS